MDQEHTRPDDQTSTQGQGDNTPDVAPDARDPYSRRRFLRAAVIGAAGVAGAAGAAGVVLANPNLPAVVGLTGRSSAVSFHDPGCSGCVTSSGFNMNVGDTCGVTPTGFQIGSNGKAQNPGDFYINFTAPNLPAGTYDVTFTPDPNFSVKGSQPYYREVFAGGTAQCCPTSGPGTTNGATLGDVFPYTISAGAAPEDLVLHVHMDYTGGVIGSPTTTKTFTFSATFTASGQATAICSETVSIVGTQQ